MDLALFIIVDDEPKNIDDLLLLIVMVECQHKTPREAAINLISFRFWRLLSQFDFFDKLMLLYL